MYGENENNSSEKEAEIPGIEGERLKHSFQRKMLIAGAQKSVDSPCSLQFLCWEHF